MFFCSLSKGRICRFNLPFSKDVLLLRPSSGPFSFDVDSDPRTDTTLTLCYKKGLSKVSFSSRNLVKTDPLNVNSIAT